MEYQLEAACCCNKGYVRQNNEDNLYFNGEILPQENDGWGEENIISCSSAKPGVSFGVFDGMGGQEDGQIASFLAAKDFKERFIQLPDNKEEPIAFLKSALLAMNDVVWKTAEKRFNQMGTTAAILYFRGENVYVCNVGDSRVYQIYGDEVMQISQDHTDAKLLKACGIERKPRLSQYVGIPPQEMIIEPYVAKNKICKDMKYLLCSDGLTDMVDKRDIGEIMKRGISAQECAEKLVSAAMERGGKDNITVIVIWVKGESVKS